MCPVVIYLSASKTKVALTDRSGSSFLIMTPKAQESKEKIDKLHFTKVVKTTRLTEHYQESEKTAPRMGDDVDNPYI